MVGLGTEPAILCDAKQKNKSRGMCKNPRANPILAMSISSEELNRIFILESIPATDDKWVAAINNF